MGALPSSPRDENFCKFCCRQAETPAAPARMPGAAVCAFGTRARNRNSGAETRLDLTVVGTSAHGYATCATKGCCEVAAPRAHRSRSDSNVVEKQTPGAALSNGCRNQESGIPSRRLAGEATETSAARHVQMNFPNPMFKQIGSFGAMYPGVENTNVTSPLAVIGKLSSVPAYRVVILTGAAYAIRPLSVASLQPIASGACSLVCN